MEIDNSQLKQSLRAALISTFPTRQDLEMMVSDQLKENLSTIAGNSNLEHTIFELIRWSEARGRLEELVDAALKQNSKNPQLISVAEQFKLRNGQKPTCDVPLGETSQYTPTVQAEEKAFRADASPEAEQSEWNSRSETQRTSTFKPLGTRLLRYTGHSSHVMSVAWSLDGKRIASGSADHTVQVWNADDGEQSFVFEASGPVMSVAWFPDEKHVACASRDGTVQVWNADNGELSFSFNAASPVGWSPNGKYIACALRDGRVQVWNTDGGELLLTYRAHLTLLSPMLGRAHSVAWSPDSTCVASVYEDGAVEVWNANGSGQPFIYKGHFNWLASYRVGSLAWSPNGKRIASGAVDKTVQVWNPDGYSQPFIHRGHCGHPRGYISSLAWSPDGKCIASASENGVVQVWNLGDKEQHIFIYKGHFGFVTSVAWSPDGKRIASGSADHTVHVWSAG